MTLTIKEDDGLFRKLEDELKSLNGSYVTVGIHGNEDSEVIKYSAKQEVERPFIRQPFDKNKDMIKQKANELAGQYLFDGKMTKKEALMQLGESFKAMILDSIRKKEYKRNSPEWIKIKGNDTPLQGITGRLIRAIRAIVK